MTQPEINRNVGQCELCKQRRFYRIRIDSSWGEYPGVLICTECLRKLIAEAEGKGE